MKSLLFSILFLSSTILSASTEADSTRLIQLQQAIAALDIEEDHCEVPCGIYGDSLRIALIDEHIRTIEKASLQIQSLSEDDNINFNQLVRWINNKEKHAEEIQEIVAQYFMHQRVKIVDMSDASAKEKYNTLLMYLHHIQVYAMKSKQGTSMDNIAKLKASVEGFSEAYFHKH